MNEIVKASEICEGEIVEVVCHVHGEECPDKLSRVIDPYVHDLDGVEVWIDVCERGLRALQDDI